MSNYIHNEQEHEIHHLRLLARAQDRLLTAYRLRKAPAEITLKTIAKFKHLLQKQKQERPDE